MSFRLLTALLTAVPIIATAQTGESLRLRATVTGEGASVVMLGGGLLGADGCGRVPEVLGRTHRVVNLQSLSAEYGLAGKDLHATTPYKRKSMGCAER